MESLGKTPIIIGLGLAAIGAWTTQFDKIPGIRLGMIPGDIVFEREWFSFYAPITTGILLSLFFSALLYAARSFRK